MEFPRFPRLEPRVVRPPRETIACGDRSLRSNTKPARCARPGTLRIAISREIMNRRTVIFALALVAVAAISAGSKLETVM
jgi:hypothetical protein